MAFSRIKARIGWNDTEERYPDTDDYTEPQAVEDPHTIEDSTRQTLTDRLLEHRWWALSVSLLAISALILVAIYFGRYFSTVLANIWVQRIGVLLAVVALARRWGRTDERSKLEDEHQLTLYSPDGDTLHFAGRYERVDGATHDTFVPYKGRRRGDPEPYRIGELSSALVNKHGRNPDDEAVIRLHDSVTDVRQTDRGLKVVQLTEGLNPDPFGKESNLEAALPDMAATETVSDLKSELEKQNEEINHLRERNNQLRRQRDDAREEARKNYEEVRKEIEKNVEMIEPFASHHTTASDGDSDGDSRRQKERQIEDGAEA